MFPIRDLNPTRITPLLTGTIIVANLLVWLFWQPDPTVIEGEDFAYENAAIACELTSRQALSLDEIRTGRCLDGSQPAEFPDKNIWLAVVVSMFLHGGLFHLLGNMWFLWVFGNNVEEAFGRVGYLLVYLVTGVAATVAFVVANPESTIPLVGASGAIAGILGAYLVLFPRHQILSWFLFLFVPVPAMLFLGIWFLGQFGVDIEMVAWQAHVGGFLAGIVVTLPLRPLLMRRVEELHRPARSVFLSR